TNKFYNIAAVLKTEQNGVLWKNAILEIEEKLGRIRSGGYTDRTIDIDILFFNPAIEGSFGLEIPHPRMSERAFVVLPLFEIRAAISGSFWKNNIEAWEKKLAGKSDIYHLGSL
ncbi:MAG: 2-amino-4-hydroxy-6-hydroxymethyldihydropteridine diphosphokinase, partial [Flavobacteriales bacterium]